MREIPLTLEQFNALGHSKITMTRETFDIVLNALKVNVDRGHFREAYEGFNDCKAESALQLGEIERDSAEEKDLCDCGYVAAAIALSLIEKL